MNNNSNWLKETNTKFLGIMIANSKHLFGYGLLGIYKRDLQIFISTISGTEDGINNGFILPHVNINSKLFATYFDFEYEINTSITYKGACTLMYHKFKDIQNPIIEYNGFKINISKLIDDLKKESYK